ncbi:MAG: sigma-70 family RNA polymerase sigma factor [Oscillospiraceae bacterium]|nr:sigma-70 family RNA polymerase sigma factor [Oscillospiraceae bacterium]
MSDITELVKKAASGDRAAFDSLYEQTKNGVWFTCISILNNEENAKDIMQDTYLTAFERLGTLSDPAAVQSWLNKIAANKCKNYITAKSNSAVESGEDVLDNIPDEGLIPEEYVEDKAKRELIMKLIRNALSEDQYRTITLYYFDEMTAAEIAALMDCHEKTVLYRLKTARVKIKQEIERYEEENREKLHAFVPMLPLSRLLWAESENTSAPNIAPAAPQASVNTPPEYTPNVPQEPAAYAVNTGGKTMLNTLKAKIIAGACAAVVVGGGVTAGVLIANGSKNKTESNPTYSAGTNYSKPTNTSKPAANSNSGLGTTSKPATSTPVSTDKVVYPKFEGLEAVEFKTGFGDEIMPDIISGSIKEMRFEGTFLFLTKDNEIITYSREGYRTRHSYGIDPGITTLDNSNLSSNGLVAVNGNHILYKVLDKDGNIALSKEGNPQYFSGEMDFGDNIAQVVVGDLANLYALDAEGRGMELRKRFSFSREYEPDDDDVVVLGDGLLYYDTYCDWGFYFVDMSVKKLIGDRFINDEGKMYRISGSGQISDKKPIDYLAEYTFKDFYAGSETVITGITENDTMVVIDDGHRKVLFECEMPEGTILNIWHNYNKMIVKTDKGVFVREYEGDEGFKPLDVLNNTGEDVVWVSNKYVLLGNGFVYEIKNFL